MATQSHMALSKSLAIAVSSIPHKKTTILLGISVSTMAIVLATIGLLLRMHNGRPPQVPGAVIAPARLAAQGKPIPRLVRCREQPLQLVPYTGLEETVTEEDLVTVLCAALPWWNPPCCPCAFHELKLWGRNAVFTRAMTGVPRSGDWLVNTLLNDAECRANTGPLGGAYLLDSPYGIRPVLVGSEDAIEYRGEGHYGQLLQIFAEAGVPAASRITTGSGRIGSLADVYQDALMRFSLAQELEFIGCALAYWHPPERTWQDQFGNEYSFDDLLRALMDRPLGKGACGGCHVPQAVVAILRVDEECGVLSDSVRRQAGQWLKRLVALLQDRWPATGGWDPSWADAAHTGSLWKDDRLDRIAVTGHHLEWMALAPLEARPASTLIKRAIVSLVVDVRSLPPLKHQSFKTLLPVSHAARALAMMRRQDPYTTWLKYWKGGRLRFTPQGYAVVNRAPRTALHALAIPWF